MNGDIEAILPTFINSTKFVCEILCLHGGVLNVKITAICPNPVFCLRSLVLVSMSAFACLTSVFSSEFLSGFSFYSWSPTCVECSFLCASFRISGLLWVIFLLCILFLYVYFISYFLCSSSCDLHSPAIILLSVSLLQLCYLDSEVCCDGSSSCSLSQK